MSAESEQKATAEVSPAGSETGGPGRRAGAWRTRGIVAAAIGLALAGSSFGYSYWTKQKAARAEAERAQQALGQSHKAVTGLLTEIMQAVRDVSPEARLNVLKSARSHTAALIALSGDIDIEAIRTTQSATLEALLREHLSRGDDEATLEAADALISELEKAQTAAPLPAVSLERVILASTARSDLLLKKGEREKAAADYDRLVAATSELARREPEKAALQHNLTLVLAKRAEMRIAMGKAEQAKGDIQSGIAIAKKFVKSDDTGADWPRELANLYMMQPGSGVDSVANLNRALDALWFKQSVRLLSESDVKMVSSIEEARDRICSEEQDRAAEAAGAGMIEEAVRRHEAIVAAFQGELTPLQASRAQKLIASLGELSWYALFSREPAKSLASADRALSIDPGLLWIATNRAHALLYLNRAQEAREVYLAHRDQPTDLENKLWQQVVGDDFMKLRDAGLEHPQMAEIEAALGIE